jgi:hypothetical protein
MSLTDDDKSWIAELMSQKLEELETHLLRAFRNFSHPVEARLRAQKIISRGLGQRLDELEDRVELLEERSGEQSDGR